MGILNELYTLNELYNEGISYKVYLDSAEEEIKQKHLHYLAKLELTQDEKEKLANLKDNIKLLVFCNVNCNDCRITLALLENIVRNYSNIEYRIVDREGNEDLMQQLSGDKRIPLVVELQGEVNRVVFNEYPEIIRNKMSNKSSEEIDTLKTDYRKGLYKKEMLEQLIVNL